MPLSSTYTTGTITVAANGTAVTGSGVNWLAAGVRSGDILAARGLTVTIREVTSATTLTLATTWPGAALSASPYEIRYTPDATRVLASSREAIAVMESLRGDVFVSSNVYASPAAGLAATEPGQQFQTISVNGQNVVRYRHDPGGVATEVARYPTAAAVTEAVATANNAAAGAADAIRAQVAADADRAVAAAASVPQKAMEYAIQTSASLPPRPRSQVVHWLTWTNPTALMQPYDLWFRQPQPTVPDMPADASWSFDNARTGSSVMLRIFAVPAASPPILTIEYRLNGGTWVSLPAVAGEHEITGLADGSTVTAELRYTNFLGNGIPTPARSAPISSAPFSDNFDRADGNLSSDARWTDVATGGGRRVAISSGALRPTGTNEAVAAQVREYFRPDQVAAATVLATGTNTSGRGVFLYVRMQPGINSGYRLRLASESMWIERVVNGAGTSLVGGARPGTLPVQAQLRVVGRALTASINGVAVLTVTDNDPAAFLSGTVGVGFNAAGADTVAGTRIDNFSAGNA